jgi:hypothetical protein
MVFLRGSGERGSVYDTDAADRTDASSSSTAPGSALTESASCVNATRNEFFHRLGRVQRGDESGGVRAHVPSAPPPICPRDDDCSIVPLPPTGNSTSATSQEPKEEDEDEEIDPELGAPLLVDGQPAPPTRSFLRGSTVSIELGGLRTSRVTSFR